MSKIYGEAEKQEYLDKYKVSGKSKTLFARENNIPEATFRAWLKDEQYAMYGAIDLTQQTDQSAVVSAVKPIIFCNDKIRIELREGYDKEFLRRVVEVISR